LPDRLRGKCRSGRLQCDNLEGEKAEFQSTRKKTKRKDKKKKKKTEEKKKSLTEFKEARYLNWKKTGGLSATPMRKNQS